MMFIELNLKITRKNHLWWSYFPKDLGSSSYYMSLCVCVILSPALQVLLFFFCVIQVKTSTPGSKAPNTMLYVCIPAQWADDARGRERHSSVFWMPSWTPDASEIARAEWKQMHEVCRGHAETRLAEAGVWRAFRRQLFKNILVGHFSGDCAESRKVGEEKEKLVWSCFVKHAGVSLNLW